MSRNQKTSLCESPILDSKPKTVDKYAIHPTHSTMTWLCGLYHIEGGFRTSSS